MKPPPAWPPIIAFARAPWWVRLRDVLITLVAWALLLYLLADGIRIVIDYFRYPYFVLTKPHPADWLNLWDHVRGFVYFAIAGMVWLSMWGVIHYTRLRRVEHVTPPPSLPLEEHAASFHLDPAMLERWRDAKVTVVQFDSDNRIISATPPPG